MFKMNRVSAIAIGLAMVVSVAIADEGGLPECVEALSACNGFLAQCEDDLSACEGSQFQFPGDGITGASLSVTDNGDGTVTDNVTGLTWEKKVAGSGPIHAKDNGYYWSEATSIFLEALNNSCNGDGAVTCNDDTDCTGIGGEQCGFTGRRDWRLPTIKEACSFCDYSPGAPVYPSVFGPLAPVVTYYWTSTTDPSNSARAFMQDYRVGGNVGTPKEVNKQRVIAVR